MVPEAYRHNSEAAAGWKNPKNQRPIEAHKRVEFPTQKVTTTRMGTQKNTGMQERMKSDISARRDGALLLVGNLPVDEVISNGALVYRSPGGVANLCKSLSVMMPPERVTPISKMGDDGYARGIIEPSLKELGINLAYLRRVSDAKSAVSTIDVTVPQQPKIERKQIADKLLNTQLLDMTPLLRDASALFYHSYAIITTFPESVTKTVAEAYRSGVPVMLDNNIRQGSVGSLMVNEEATRKIYEKLDMLKVNEGEAKIMLDSEIKKPIEEIKIYENELYGVANKLMSTYNMKAVAITMGEHGSYILTEQEELRLQAIRPKRYINSLGAGDSWSAGYCMKYVWGLNAKEAGFLGSVLGSMATEEVSAYPANMTRERIISTIKNNCAEQHIEPYKLLTRLGG